MNNNPTVHWFRTDLRLSDNPALCWAAERGAPVLGLYVVDTTATRAPGGASRWWLGQSLTALAEALAAAGSALVILKGDPAALLPELADRISAGAVVWNRRYGAADRALDAALKTRLRQSGRLVQSFNSHLLREPWEVRSAAGQPMKVFTPFWRAARAMGPFAPPCPAPARLGDGASAPLLACLDGLPRLAPADILRVPAHADWTLGLGQAFRPGEAAARDLLAQFLDEILESYTDDRDRPDRPATSRLSPHLAFGEIGPRQIAAATAMAEAADGSGRLSRHAEKFLAELGWREFSYHLLYSSPAMADQPIAAKFAAFPWQDDPAALAAWQRGRTGYPIVDAGMRQLWQTGWMHNRVRMVVASFLIKHLQIDWREGERWFWDTLVDADPASNPASWQWVAGCGADAAPYYRIFNPVLQGLKFDPDGAYVRCFVPELARLPAAHIHAPWLAPAAVLAEAGIVPGQTYPAPIVDHSAARARALAVYQAL